MSKQITIAIPEGLEFSALRLERDSVTHDLSFDWAPIEQICQANNLDIALFRDSPEDNVAGLITAWYADHRANGGAPDQVQEQILAEVETESVAEVYRIQSAPGEKQ